MPLIRPISDLRNNFAEISRIVHETSEPVFLTKNGYGDMVVISVDLFEQLGITAALLEQKSKNPETPTASAPSPARAPAATSVSASAHAPAAEKTPAQEKVQAQEKIPEERVPVPEKILKPLSMWQKTLSEFSDLTPKELSQNKAAGDGSDVKEENV